MSLLNPAAVLLAAAAGWLVAFAALRWGFPAVLDTAYRKGWLRYPDAPPNAKEGAEAATLRRRMVRLARTTLLLVPADGQNFSKLGGQPDLPPGIDWPVGERTPRTFVAQIELADVHAAEGPEWLPKTGCLYVFHDERRNGFADNTIVLFSNAAPETAEAAHGSSSFAERRISFLPRQSIPSLDWLGIDLRDTDISDAELDDLANAPDEPFGSEPQHRIGGYPAEIQESQMQLECEYLARGLTRTYSELPPDAIVRASKQWRLLLQIDSDPALGMNWGDGGRLYVFIREKHARADDFSKTVSLWQTY